MTRQEGPEYGKSEFRRDEGRVSLGQSPSGTIRVAGTAMKETGVGKPGFFVPQSQVYCSLDAILPSQDRMLEV